jgi:hypothetical protein
VTFHLINKPSDPLDERGQLLVEQAAAGWATAKRFTLFTSSSYVRHVQYEVRLKQLNQEYPIDNADWHENIEAIYKLRHPNPLARLRAYFHSRS